MNLGLTIKNIRKQKGLNQLLLAETSGITQTYLSQIENNVKEPNVSVLNKIAESLETPLPLIFFLSMDENDVAPAKRDAYNMIAPSIKSLINGIFNPA